MNLLDDLILTIKAHILDDVTINEVAATMYYTDNPRGLIWEDVDPNEQLAYTDETYRVLNALTQCLYPRDEYV